MKAKVLLVGLLSFCVVSCSNESTQNNNDSGFDISSLNGKTFYSYDFEYNEVLIPEVDLPYTYTIPDYLYNTGGWSSFEEIKIQNSKIYTRRLLHETHDNVVTYQYSKEEEIKYTKIYGRYFTDYSEIILDNDLIYYENVGYFATRDFMTKNNSKVFNIESQHNGWVANEATLSHADIRDILNALTLENNKATLPNKALVRTSDPMIEVDVIYESIEPSTSYELNGYEITLKTSDKPELSIRYHQEYKGCRSSVKQYYLSFNA